MKRNIVIFITLGSLLLSSCFNQLIPDISSGEEQQYQLAKSSVNIKIFIPDYRKLAETGRAIAPQTAYVRLSVANGSDYTQHGNLIPVNMSSLEPVENAPSNLPGGIWNGTFTELDCKTYSAGSLKIELLDQDRRVVTQGVNQTAVTVTKNQAAQAVFFTTPEKFNRLSGSLAIGEMRFWKVSMTEGHEYQLTVSAEGAYPDIVVFNDDGTFREYHHISTSAEGIVLFTPAASGDCYMGVWADSVAVSSYSIALSYKFEDSRVDFSAGFNGWIAYAVGSYAPLPEIVDEDGTSILEFDSRPMYPGDRVSLSHTVNFSVPTALSFNVKTDIGGAAVQTYFKLYINGVEQASYDGLGASWKTGSFFIPTGSCEIKWILEKDSGSYYPSPRTNKVWLADISLSPDVTAYVDIHPKGPKDTYVGGFAIPFTARALRADSSIRPGASVAYSGTGVNPATGLFTPPAVPGTYRVTATVDGKTASSDIITVHPADYLSKPYTYLATGKTYYGYEGGSGSMTPVTGITFSRPAQSAITADGFVTLEGEAQYPRNVYLTKDGSSSASTTYPLPAGRFSVRIWLRFGPGQYRITVSSPQGQQIFMVTNTCTDTGADGGDPRFLYPSSVVQSGDFRITNRLTDLRYGVSGEADRIKIIHDYLVQNTTYDYDSLTDRKPQDALSVLGTRYFVDTRYTEGHYFAVCEGYSNAAAALLRAAGIETRYVSSTAMNHGWNHVFTGGSWKFMDVTWDDPTVSGTQNDFGPDYVRYKYYLLTTLDGVDGDHYDDVVDNFRSVVPVIPKMKGMPDGWY
jgi:transglutaminase-like putative cysteine protease